MPDPDTPPPDDADVAILDLAHRPGPARGDGDGDGDGEGDGDGDGGGGHDWTLDLPDTPHVRFFRNTDWAKSPLGPLSTWNATLRLFTRMVFADSRAACIWWYDAHNVPNPTGPSRWQRA